MTVRFGWCLTGHHDQCPGVIKFSDQKTRECDCPHHAQVKKDLEELL